MRYIVFYYSSRWHIAKRCDNTVYFSIAETDSRENAIEICDQLNLITDIT